MIIKKFFSPQLSIALSFFAASGCFAAIPSYYHEDDKNGHVIEGSHKNISLRKNLQHHVTADSIKVGEPLPGGKGPRAEEYKKRLAAIKESYHELAESVQIEKEEADTLPVDDAIESNVKLLDGKHVRSQMRQLENPALLEDSCKRPSAEAEFNRKLEDATNNKVLSKVDRRAKDLVALSSPYGEEEQIEEERDWGNDLEGAQDMMPSDFDAEDKSVEDNAPADDPLDDDEFDEGVLGKEGSFEDSDVAFVQGRREESRDVRTSNQLPANSGTNRSAINTDARRSRVPKTSLQSQRQREATNNLRTRVAKVTKATENGGQFEYYEDYLASLSGEPRVDNETPELAPERKPYTKQRRRPVKQDSARKDDTAMNDDADDIRFRIKRNRLKRKRVDTIRSAPTPAPAQEPVQPKRRVRALSRDQRLAESETTEKTTQVARRVVAKQQPAAVRPVVVTASMIKKASVEQPSFQNAPRTYVADNGGKIIPQDDEDEDDYDDEDEDEDGDEGDEEANLTTDRQERPNWYDRLDGQRRERLVQQRVRQKQGEANPNRGYPTIPQYTQGNTTPR